MTVVYKLNGKVIDEKPVEKYFGKKRLAEMIEEAAEYQMNEVAGEYAVWCVSNSGWDKKYDNGCSYYSLEICCIF